MAKFLQLACIRNESSYGDLSPRAHYPSMPKYPKGVSVSPDEEKTMEGTEAKAVFSVTGMTCSACAGSVEKAVKRLPGIKEAVVDVLNNKAQVLFYPSFVNVSKIPFFISLSFSQSLCLEIMKYVIFSLFRLTQIQIFYFFPVIIFRNLNLFNSRDCFVFKDFMNCLI